MRPQPVPTVSGYLMTTFDGKGDWKGGEFVCILISHRTQLLSIDMN